MIWSNYCTYTDFRTLPWVFPGFSPTSLTDLPLPTSYCKSGLYDSLLRLPQSVALKTVHQNWFPMDVLAITALLSSDVPTPLPSWFFHLYVTRHLRFNLSRAKVYPFPKASAISVVFIKVNGNSIYPLDRVRNVSGPCLLFLAPVAIQVLRAPLSFWLYPLSPMFSATSLVQVSITTPPDYWKISLLFPKLEFLPSDSPFSI